MRTYYTQKRAQHYNQLWQSFSAKTLAATISLLEVTRLQQKASTRTRRIRILDVACGTGLLLVHLARLLPNAELYGVDASQPMLTQATALLHDHPYVHLVQSFITDEERAGLPYPSAFFDLITCTNSLHYFSNPLATLRGLRHLLAPGGQLVIEDYMLRGSPLLWKAFEPLIRLCDSQHVRLFTCSAAQALCQQAGLQILHSQTFPIDLVCQGWALLLQPAGSQ